MVRDVVFFRGGCGGSQRVDDVMWLGLQMFYKQTSLSCIYVIFLLNLAHLILSLNGGMWNQFVLSSRTCQRKSIPSLVITANLSGSDGFIFSGRFKLPLLKVNLSYKH